MSTQITKELINTFKKAIISLHDECIQKSGGTFGIRSEGTLEFTIYDILKLYIKNQDKPDLIAAYACLSIATKHCFFDGNKRTAHLFAKQLLFERGIYLTLHYKEACHFILKIADGKKSIKEIQLWFKDNTKLFDKRDTEKYLRDFIQDINYAKT